MRTQRRCGKRGEPGADEQRVAEVEARDGGDRVVEGAEQVRAEVDLGALRDRVGEAEPGEPWRRGREGEVADEGEARRDDQRRPHGGERARPAAMHPDEEGDRRHEVERDVENAEDARARPGTDAEPAWMPRSQKIPRERSSPTMSAVCRRAAVQSSPPKPRTSS